MVMQAHRTSLRMGEFSVNRGISDISFAALIDAHEPNRIAPPCPTR